MTEIQEAVREGSSLETPEPESNPQSAQRARSIALPSFPAKEAVTQRVRKAGEITSRIGPLLDKPGTLVHSQPPTFRQAHARHHECAGHFGSPLVKALRLLWGYFHLLVIKPALNLAEWLTESPLRFLLSALLVSAVWFFS